MVKKMIKKEVFTAFLSSFYDVLGGYHGFARCYGPSHNGPIQTAAECGGLSYNCIHTLAAFVKWQQWPEELLKVP